VASNNENERGGLDTKTIFIATAVGSLLAVLSQCAFAETGRYPRGTDMCAQYVISSTQRGTSKKLVTTEGTGACYSIHYARRA
jgi:hypothetical protein